MADGLCDSISGSWEFRALLMRPAADEKKLFLWREVLVLMYRSLLPEGSGWNRVCPGWEESATGPSRDGRLQPITSAVQRIHCSLLFSLAVASVYLMAMKEVRMDSMIAV